MAVSSASPRRARVGVALLFFTNGALYSALLPRLPELKHTFGLDNVGFGLVVIAFPVGSVLAAWVAAPLIRRFGATRVTAAGSVLLAGAMWAAGSAHTTALFVVAMGAGGVADAVVDAAQNVHGVAVERWYGRSILNSFHAVWSVGAASGAAIGAAGAAAGVSISLQMALSGLVWAGVAVIASALAAAPAAASISPLGGAAPRLRAGAWRLLLPLVVLAVSGTMVEDVAYNWVPLFLRQETAASAGIAGLGVSAVLVFQFAGRLSGDRLTDRFGRERVARTGGLAIAAGFLVVIVAPGYGVAFAGLALAGLGCATLVPAAFAAADRIPGLPHATGVALLGWLMRLGFLVTSPGVGSLSQLTNLRTAFLIPLGAGVMAAAMAQLSLARNFERGSGARNL